MMSKTAIPLWDNWNRSGGPRYPHEKVIQFLFRRFPDTASRAGCRVLDLGCGGGVNTLFLAREGFEAHASDISPVGVENTRCRLAQAGCSATLSVGSVDTIAYPDNYFEALVSIGVLECAGFSLLRLAFSEVVRVLSPGAPAILLFASDLDFRLSGDNPLGLHGFTDAEVLDAAGGVSEQLADFWMDRYITTYESQRLQQNEHLVTLVKSRA